MVDWRLYYDDPDTILKEQEVDIVIEENMWFLVWKHGCIQLGDTCWLTKPWAKVQAALFVHLWSLGVGAAEADDISCNYVYSHNWFKQRQRVFQLRAICLDGEVDFSKSVWYSRDMAEAAKDGFKHTCVQRGLRVKTIDIIPLEVAPWLVQK